MGPHRRGNAEEVWCGRSPCATHPDPVETWLSPSVGYQTTPITSHLQPSTAPAGTIGGGQRENCGRARLAGCADREKCVNSTKERHFVRREGPCWSDSHGGRGTEASRRVRTGPFGRWDRRPPWPEGP